VRIEKGLAFGGLIGITYNAPASGEWNAFAVQTASAVAVLFYNSAALSHPPTYNNNN
jgi:hypothetical protein